MFAVGPVGVETDNSGVYGEEKIVVVSSTFGDPSRFGLSGGGFVRKSLEAPVAEVTKLPVGQVILWVQARGVSSSVDNVPL